MRRGVTPAVLAVLAAALLSSSARALPISPPAALNGVGEDANVIKVANCGWRGCDHRPYYRGYGYARPHGNYRQYYAFSYYDGPPAYYRPVPWWFAGPYW